MFHLYKQYIKKGESKFLHHDGEYKIKILKDQKAIGKSLKWRETVFNVRLIYRNYNICFIHYRGVWYTSVDSTRTFENTILPYLESTYISLFKVDKNCNSLLTNKHRLKFF